MTIDQELIDMLRTEVRAGVSDLRAEMQAGNKELRAEMQAGNKELRAEMQAGNKELRSEMQAGNKELRSEMQAMAKDLRGEMQNMGTTLGARIDQTNVRLDKTNAILVDFQKEVFVKFAGVTDLLLASENNVARLERRIIKLEDQQASPEKRQDSA